MCTLCTALALAEGNEKSHKKFICCVYCLSREFTSEYNKVGGSKIKVVKKKHIQMNLKTVMASFRITKNCHLTHKHVTVFL